MAAERTALLACLTLLGRLSPRAREADDRDLAEERNRVIAQGWRALGNRSSQDRTKP